MKMKETMKQLSLQKQILDRIKAQQVRPTPKSFFRVRDYVLWGILGVSVAALSLGSSMVIMLIRGIDRGVLGRLGLSLPEKLFYSIPFFWVAVTLAIAAVAYVNFKRTRRGYRVSAKQFAITAVVVGVALGTLMYALNISRYVDRAAVQNIPIYSSVVPLNTNGWFDPAHGLLSGSVKIKESDESFTLRDQNFDLWTVSSKDASVNPEEFKFNSGDRVKIIGKKTGDFEFRAVEIRPFETQIKKADRDSATTTGSSR